MTSDLSGECRSTGRSCGPEGSPAERVSLEDRAAARGAQLSTSALGPAVRCPPTLSESSVASQG